jgi:hypothetical protein
MWLDCMPEASNPTCQLQPSANRLVWSPGPVQWDSSLCVCQGNEIWRWPHQRVCGIYLSGQAIYNFYKPWETGLTTCQSDFFCFSFVDVSGDSTAVKYCSSFLKAKFGYWIMWSINTVTQIFYKRQLYSFFLIV